MNDFEELSRKRARLFFSLKHLELPVDIESIVREYADIEEDFIPCDGDAICINREGRPLIILKKDAIVSRRRFTLAHELGHIQIPWHVGMLSCHTDEPERIDTREYYRMEKEANTFAAELLMPTPWIRDLVTRNLNKDIKEIVNVICQRALVSFSAALYNLINVLPDGYVFFIENKRYDYTHRKISGNTGSPVFLFNEAGYDFRWIYFNSYQEGTIEHEILNIHWFKYKEILGQSLIDEHISQLSDEYNLSDLLIDVINSDEFSVAFTLKVLADRLPSGYILKTSFKPTKSYDYLMSKKTFINPVGFKEKDKDNWFNRYCHTSGEYKDKNMIIQWWYFITEFDFNFHNEDRDSKAILKNIIDNEYPKNERMTIFGIVNGFIGSLNNKRDTMTQEQFFNILRQKFIGNVRLAPVIAHKDFNNFLVKKTLELYRK